MPEVVNVRIMRSLFESMAYALVNASYPQNITPRIEWVEPDETGAYTPTVYAHRETDDAG